VKSYFTVKAKQTLESKMFMRITFVFSLLLFGVGSKSVLADSQHDRPVTYVEGFSSKTYTLGGSQAVEILDNSLSVNSTDSRRSLAELFSSSVNIGAGQVYHVYFSGYSCVKFSITSSPEDLHVMLMKENNYQTFAANSYTGAYLYVQGSLCEQTYSCAKTISGLSSSTTYYLVAINDYDGLFGGQDATTQVLVETCPSSSRSAAGLSVSGINTMFISALVGVLAIFA